MKLILSLFWVFTLSVISVQAQVLKGVVVDADDASVAFANVILNDESDAMVKLEYTEDDGFFTMQGIEAGTYKLVISFVGLADHTTTVTLASGETKDLGTIQMKPVSNELTEVTVTATRPILEVKPDKLVFNVEGSVNAIGSDGLELLRKAPGVIVDNEDNISLAGKSGVRIFIDGKPSPLRGEDLAEYLKGMNSNAIDNIEIITSPSARYEAEGNAGIINIKLKKSKKAGSNATVSLGYNIGKKQSYRLGLSGNYKNEKVNAFGSYNFRRRNGYFKMDNHVTYSSGITQEAENIIGGDGYANSFKLGADFFLTKKSTLGILMNGNTHTGDRNSDNVNKISRVNQVTIDSFLVANTNTDRNRNNYTFNVNYQYKISKDKLLSTDVDYGRFRRKGAEHLVNQYQSVSGANLSRSESQTDSPTEIDIYTFKIDYEQPLWQGKFSTGVKNTWVNTDNVFDFYDIENGQKILNQEQSRQFTFLENINAAYINYTKQLNKKWNVSLGVRTEYTNTKGTLKSSVPIENPETKREYIDFFPSGGLTFTPSKKNSFAFSYSRRLDRPNYQNLNPFVYRANELLSRSGNPFLRPQYSNNLQLSHTFNFRYTTSFNFSHTTDLMTRIGVPDGENSRTLTWKNIADQFNYSLSFSAPVSFTSWWSSFNTFTGFHTRNKAEKTDEIEAIDLKVTAGRLYSQHSFKLPWKMKYEISGWYSTPSIWGGTFETDANWSIDMGVSKKLFKDKANLKISFDDIFKTSGWSGVNRYGDAIFRATGQGDSRRLKINFSYSFGNKKIRARKRKTGLDDVKGRTSGED